MTLLLYAIYYDVLSGERKGDGLIAEQMDTLHNPRELAMIGVEDGNRVRALCRDWLGCVALHA